MRVFKKLRVQLVVIVLICYLVPVLVLGFYVGGAVLKDFQAKTEAALATGVDYSMMLAEQGVKKLVALSQDAVYDGELADAVAQRDAGNLSDGEFLRRARAYIERKYGREALLTFAACFTLDNPDLLLTNRGGSDAAAAYQRKAHEAVKAMGDELDTQGRFVRVEDEVYLVRNLMNLRMKPYGMLVLGVDVDALAAPLTALAKEWEARLDIDLDGVLLTDVTATGGSGPEGADWEAIPAGRIVSAGAGQYAYARDDDDRDCDLRAGLVLGRARLYGELDAFRLLLGGLLVLLVPILAVIAWYVYRRITKPLAILADAARRIEAGELGVTVPMQGEDELGALGKAFSNMSLRLEELIDRTYKEEIALRDARIQAMQSRINPHFINNALETINWQARMEGSETISAMVESLSVLLNAGMSRNDRRILSLREELETAKAYFYFVGLRFGDSLVTRMDAAPEALEDMLPSLTLQPLIENAVEHGIAPAGGGEILLRCGRGNGRLQIEVANTGKAATAEDRKRIDAALRGDSESGSHLGLANISMRLKLIYGGRADLRVVTDEPGWTRVLIGIPQDTDFSMRNEE